MKIIMIDNSNYLMHHGVKGQKWGVRRQQKKEQRMERRARAKWSREWHKTYNKAADRMNEKIPSINAKYDGNDLGWNGNEYTTKLGKRYEKEYRETWNKIYTDAIIEDYGTKLGEEFVKKAPFMM